MKQVITIQGKAKNVFRYTALLAKHQGNKKIKDVKQHSQSLP
jgi:cytochrome c-type biogenesis protein CcmE